jgi:hypothetical protein
MEFAKLNIDNSDNLVDYTEYEDVIKKIKSFKFENDNNDELKKNDESKTKKSELKKNDDKHSYSRIKHFSNWLSQFKTTQEQIDIPEEIIEKK